MREENARWIERVWKLESELTPKDFDSVFKAELLTVLIKIYDVLEREYLAKNRCP